MSHWHVLVHEGGKEPRRVAVHERGAAEREAKLEADGCSLAWVPKRRVEIIGCDKPCLGAAAAERAP